MSSDIEIFTAPNCSHCNRAKELLRARGLAFRERDVSDAGCREEMLRRLPRTRSIPQVFIDGEHIGGCEDLELLDRRGGLGDAAVRASS